MNTRIKTSCPHCQNSVKVSAELIGKRVRCPECRQPFEITSVAFGGGQSLMHSEEALATQEGWETENAGEEDSSGLDRSSVSSTRRSPTIGHVGRFELKQTLGQGSFGRVYLAFDAVLDRQVALKVPRFDRSDERRVRRFLAEAKAAAQLRHPNIVTVFESGQADDELYIASEYVEGEPLSRRIASGPVDQRQAAQWVRELADALAYAHGEGVIHRDIKPENIMLSARGRPQIMDFGLAKRIDADDVATADGSILGTPAYMPPEQARGDLDNVGPASDQYSLGVTLYELLTGKRPFEGPAHTVIHAVVSEEPKPPSQLNDDIHPDLEAICLKAMGKEPERRYESANELADDLDRWLTSRPVLARPIGTAERFARWCRRNPRVATLTATILVMFVTGFSVSVWQWNSARRLFRQAERSRIEADELRTIAETSLKDTRRERDRAESAQHQLATALKEAQENLKEANRQRKIAEENQQLAAMTKKEADTQKSLVAKRDSEVQDQKQKLESQVGASRRQAYVTDLGFTLKSIKQNDVVRTRELLNNWFQKDPKSEDVRGFEWHYLARTFGTWGPESLPPNKRIERISWDGRYVQLRSTKRSDPAKSFSEGVDRTVWDTVLRQDVSEAPQTLASDEQLLNELFATPFDWMPAWDAATTSIQFNAGGRSIEVRDGKAHPNALNIVNRFTVIRATPTKVMTVILGGGEKQKPPITFETDWMTFSRDGSVVAYVDKQAGAVHCLRIATGEVKPVAVAPVIIDDCPRCWLSPRGEFLVAVRGHITGDEWTIWNVESGLLVTSIIDLNRGSKITNEPEFSAEEPLVLLGRASTSQLDIVNSMTTRPVPITRLSNVLATYALTDGETTVLFESAKEGRQKSNPHAPKAERLVSKDVRSFYWPERAIPHHYAAGNTVFIGKHAELAEAARAGQSTVPTNSQFNATLLGLLRGEEHTLIRAHSAPIQRLFISANDHLGFTYAENGELKVWSLPSGRPVASLSQPLKGLAVAPTSRPNQFVLARQDVVDVWNSTGLTRVAGLTKLPGNVTSCCSTPDGRKLVLQVGTDWFGVWDTVAGIKEWEFPFGKNNVATYDIQTDGRIVAFALMSGSVQLYRTSGGELVKSIKDVGSVKVIRISPDGKLLVTGNDKGVIQLYDIDTGERRATIPGHRGSVTCFAFSADGKNFASGSTDQTIKTWDLEIGKERYTFDGHTAPLTALEFMPDGRILLSGDKNGSLHIWRGR